MKCPNCGVESHVSVVDCSACGIIFAKYLAQREREKKEAAEFLARTELPASITPSYWPARIAAIIVLLIWLVGLVWYYVEALNARDERIQSDLRARSRARAASQPVSPR